MSEKDIAEQSLKELALKYDAARVTGFEKTARGCRVTTSDKGVFEFSSDFGNLKGNEIPMYPWRAKRSFFEMANIQRTGAVKEPLAMRIKSIQQPETCSSLLSVLLREMDVAERVLLGDKIVRIFSAPDIAHSYMNTLCATESGIKISMELGIAPSKSGTVELHEVVCRTGIITDTACDTQVSQYPIYVYGNEGQETFADTDFELYGIAPGVQNEIRYILQVLASKDAGDSIRSDYSRQVQLAEKALKGGLVR